MGCAKHTVHQPASQQQQLQNTRKFSVVFQSNPNTELWPKKFFRQRLTRCAVRRIVHIHYGFRCRCSTWMRAPSSGNLFCCGKSAVIFYSTENTPRSLFVCMGCIREKKASGVFLCMFGGVWLCMVLYAVRVTEWRLVCVFAAVCLCAWAWVLSVKCEFGQCLWWTSQPKKK